MCTLCSDALREHGNRGVSHGVHRTSFPTKNLPPELFSCNGPNGVFNIQSAGANSEATATIEDILSDPRTDLRAKIVQLRGDEVELSLIRVSPIEFPLGEREQDSRAQIFDVFLCHNSVDKPAVRENAEMLVKVGIKPWLDEEQIRPGASWQSS